MMQELEYMGIDIEETVDAFKKLREDIIELRI